MSKAAGQKKEENRACLAESDLAQLQKDIEIITSEICW